MTKWRRSDMISAIAVVSSFAVFGFGVWQYRSSENWKRSEFVASQIKDFNSDKTNIAVLMMMDYDPAHVELYPEKATESERFVDTNINTLIGALDKEAGFSREEFQTRIYFEHFLTSLSRFSYFIDRGAIEPVELCADLSYPVELLTGHAEEMKRRNNHIEIGLFASAVRAYLDRWQAEDIKRFFDSIGRACNTGRHN